VTGPGGDDRKPPTVAPLTVPLLFAGLVIGFFSGYFFLLWGLVAVGAVVIRAVSMVLTGRSRDAATGLLVGTVAAYAVVLGVAVFRGVL